jgi:hypothetical protein
MDAYNSRPIATEILRETGLWKLTTHSQLSMREQDVAEATVYVVLACRYVFGQIDAK